MPMITNVKILQDYCLELTFDDGVCGTVDLSDKVGKGVFAFCATPKPLNRCGLAPPENSSGTNGLICARIPYISK